ncbi:hypothetical protein BJX68DRAFT_263965 [Aspergillus pseudodeflectus]|uniref:Uncharacterized protein n=1 Tax=Aspergillus pseudodeflectus TaxID=176178 RepID=A0ABR4KTJ5_9EURO
MAATNGISIRNLNGNWVMDKARSTNVDAVFKLQGVGWVTRKAIAAATPSLKITQWSDADSVGSSSSAAEWMLLEPALAGVLKPAPEKRSMTWTEAEYNDSLFGRVVIRSQYISGEKTSDGRVRPLVKFQTMNLGADAESVLGEPVIVSQDEAFPDTVEKAFIHDFVRSVDSGWTAEQIWAVELVGEEVILSRRAVVAKGSSTESARVIYTYQ